MVVMCIIFSVVFILSVCYAYRCGKRCGSEDAYSKKYTTVKEVTFKNLCQINQFEYIPLQSQQYNETVHHMLGQMLKEMAGVPLDIETTSMCLELDSSSRIFISMTVQALNKDAFEGKDTK